MLPVFRPGDTLRGNIIIDTDTEMKADELKLDFIGKSEVDTDDYVREHKYIEETMVLWRSTQEDTEQVSDDPSQLMQYITAGRHVFPFEFNIPIDVKGSIPNLLNNKLDVCLLMYRLKALCYPKMKYSLGVHACKGIWIHSPIDIALNPNNLTQICELKSVTTGLLLKSGQLTIKVILHKRAFVRNDTIKVLVDINNSTSSPVDSISARVVLTPIFGDHVKLSAFKTKLFDTRPSTIRVIGEGIKARETKRILLDVPLDFSESHVDGNIIPIEQVSLIKIDYELVIKAKRSGMHRDVEVRIPIVIGTEDSSTKGPPPDLRY